MKWKRRMRRRAQKKHQRIFLSIRLPSGSSGEHVLGPSEAPFTISMRTGRRLGLDAIRHRVLAFRELPPRATLDWYAGHVEHFGRLGGQL